jgi:hypothetical protein
MIEEYVTDLAKQMGISLSRVSTVEGSKVGCLDMHLLNMSSKGKTVSALIFKSELDELVNGKQDDRLELKVRSALGRLILSIEP